VAGSAAILLVTDIENASPIDPEEMIWPAEELHFEKLPKEHRRKPIMQTLLPLECLEEYDKPDIGDLHCVEAVGSDFVYFQGIRR